jgi:uncharacterized membrane protein (UPF0127 family)
MNRKNRKIILKNNDGSQVELAVEIADNPLLHALGLMGRKSLGEYEGMLFVFDNSRIRSFWMFNTSIALDAIHIAENGTVVDIIEMEPCGLNVLKCKHYSPRAPSKFVLEVNGGFSKRQNIEIGKSRLALGQL